MQSKVINVFNPESGKYICFVFSTQSFDEVSAYARDAKKLLADGNFDDLNDLFNHVKEIGIVDDIREDVEEISGCSDVMVDGKGNKYEVTLFV